MTIGHCSDTVLHQIEDELDRHENRALYPISLGYHVPDGWLVSLEVNSPDGTFDIETRDARREIALSKALVALRGAFVRPTPT